MTTVPFAGCVTEEIVFGPASTSVSFVRTPTVLAPESSATVGASFTATGGSSTAAIVTACVSGTPKPLVSRAW
jgi:hypothetical protein